MTTDFDTLYRANYSRVFGLCLRLLGQPAQAEDASQEVFVRAYRSLDRYDPAQPFTAWLLAIANNHCIDLIRRRAREPARLEEPQGAEETATDATAALDVLVDAERGEELRVAIAALPDRYRVPLVLAYFNDWSYDRIAAELGVTRNHVGVLLLRARRSLRQALAGQETFR